MKILMYLLATILFMLAVQGCVTVMAHEKPKQPVTYCEDRSNRVIFRDPIGPLYAYAPCSEVPHAGRA